MHSLHVSVRRDLVRQDAHHGSVFETITPLIRVISGPAKNLTGPLFLRLPPPLS
jgi:hypothetical protein